MNEETVLQLLLVAYCVLMYLIAGNSFYNIWMFLGGRDGLLARIITTLAWPIGLLVIGSSI